MTVSATLYTPLASNNLGLTTGTLALDRTRGSLWTFDVTTGTEGGRQWSLDAPYVETAQYEYAISTGSFAHSRLGAYTGNLFVSVNTDDVQGLDPTDGTVAVGPTDSTSITDPHGAEARAGDGSTYFLSWGISSRFDVFDTTGGVLLHVAGATAPTSYSGVQPVIPAAPDPVTGNAQWIVTAQDSAGTPFTIYIVSTDGATISVDSFLTLTAANSSTYIGEVINGPEYVCILDVPRNQVVLAVEGPTSTVHVIAIDRDDNTTINWSVDVGSQLIHSLDCLAYGDSTYTYTFPFISNASGTSAQFTLLDLTDGTIIEQGTADVGTSVSTTYSSYVWDENRNSLYLQTNSATDSVARITFGDFNPVVVTPATNALAFLTSPTFAPILRSSDITAVVNENATFLQGILDEFADLDGFEYLNLDIDLNGYSFTNMIAEGTDPTEVNRRD